LEGNFSTSRPDAVWFSDLTYLPTREGWLYLAVVLDAFSPKVVGWAMSERLTTALAKGAFEMTCSQRKPAPGLILHSDRGSQYTSRRYQSALQAAGALPSLGGTCLDNAVAESFFATLKTEEVQGQPYETRAQGRCCVFDYLEGFYNRQRRHTSLGFLSPACFEENAVNLNQVSVEAG
jgi:transposase InsO family protein